MYRILLSALLLSSGVLAATADDGASRDVVVVKPPVPEYPSIPSWLGLAAICEVRFAVDEQGLAFSLTAECSNPMFCNEAKRSVSRAKFLPKLVDGVPQVRTNIVYPLQFGGAYIDEETGEEIVTPPPPDLPIVPCDDIAVS